MPLFTYELYEEFVKNDADIRTILKKLPAENYDFLKLFFLHLNRVSEQKNEIISLKNIVDCISTELIRPLVQPQNDIDASDSITKIEHHVINLILVQYKSFFDNDPIVTNASGDYNESISEMSIQEQEKRKILDPDSSVKEISTP